MGGIVNGNLVYIEHVLIFRASSYIESRGTFTNVLNARQHPCDFQQVLFAEGNRNLPDGLDGNPLITHLDSPDMIIATGSNLYCINFNKVSFQFYNYRSVGIYLQKILLFFH